MLKLICNECKAEVQEPVFNFYDQSEAKELQLDIGYGPFDPDAEHYCSIECLVSRLRKSPARQWPLKRSTVLRGTKITSQVRIRGGK